MRLHLTDLIYTSVISTPSYIASSTSSMLAVLWAIIALLGLYLLFVRFLDFSRDVPPEYLNQQSLAEGSRKPNELAIHKSTKLDYSTGLRVGLGIRYDHYKLRHGNLNDIWELLITKRGSCREATITVCGEPIKVKQLNYVVHQLIEYFKSFGNCTEVAVSVNDYMSTKQTLAIAVAAFLQQIPLHIYEESSKHLIDPSAILFTKNELRRAGTDGVLLNLDKLDFSREKSTFQNDYSLEKDKGVALKVSMRVNHKVLASTLFTQLNLVSAVASCIKHLPPSQELVENDRILILQSHSAPDSILNETVKVLALFVAGAELVLTSSEKYMDYNPTVLVCVANDVRKLKLGMPQSAVLAKLALYLRMFSLSRLRFGKSWATTYPNLRLVYVHRDCSEGRYTNWNIFRATLGVQIVEELGHFTIAGPLLVTDFYDYRTFPTDMSSKLAGSGGVVQANEIKLLNYDATQSGEVAIRGYNIGRAVTIMEGVGQTKVAPDEEGFYRLPYVGRWGSDGCLYLMRKNQ